MLMLERWGWFRCSSGWWKLYVSWAGLNWICRENLLKWNGRESGGWLWRCYGGLYIFSAVSWNKNMEDSSAIACLVFTGMHENEKRLKPTHTVLISRCWVWRNYGVQKEKNRCWFLTGFIITSSWEMVVWNDSGSWITLETNCFQILNPYSKIDRCRSYWLVLDWKSRTWGERLLTGEGVIIRVLRQNMTGW